MPEDNPPENDLANRVAPEDMTQSLNTTAPTDMVAYEHKTEPQDEPNDVPPEVTARDTPQIIPQDVPENVQVHDQPRPDKGTSRESVSQEQVYGNNIPLVDEPVRQTGSRFTLRRTHPVDAHGRKSPGERDLTGETLTEESLTEGNLIEHTRAKLKLTDQSLTKKTLIGQALTERIHTN
ncbi:hypothetical protein FOZG_16510 [Fusarium oxysporum Fo47]|nr:hypothetical protein FOZG_16510 [Fusarium oxysporum Fo47]